jgi:TusE/DsrC/DsvC family sulfur relay protein
MMMTDTGKIMDNPDTSSSRKSDREKEMGNWNLEKGAELAAHEGIELTDAHWQVVHKLREYYLEHGLPESGRVLGDMLDSEFAEQGGRRYLRRLFPEGPVAQGMRIAGLPVPAYTEDEGFCTAR